MIIAEDIFKNSYFANIANIRQLKGYKTQTMTIIVQLYGRLTVFVKLSNMQFNYNSHCTP